MESKTNRESVTIVNRNYPPQNGATGLSALELVNYLSENFGVLSQVVTITNFRNGIDTNALFATTKL